MPRNRGLFEIPGRDVAQPRFGAGLDARFRGVRGQRREHGCDDCQDQCGDPQARRHHERKSDGKQYGREQERSTGAMDHGGCVGRFDVRHPGRMHEHRAHQ